MVKNIGELRFGLELECQRAYGYDKNHSFYDDEDEEIDEDATQAAIDESYYYLCNERLDWGLPTNMFNRLLVEWGKEYPERFPEWYEENPRFSYSEFNDEFEECDAVTDFLQEAAEHTDTVYFERERIDFDRWVSDQLPAKVSNIWSTDSDASVSGCEFVLDGGGIPYDGTIDAIGIITDVELQIDSKCSFHVHVSEENRRHKYGPRFQYLMCKYIADRLSSCPTGLLDRWNTEWRTRYYAFAKSDKRMSFVAYRSEHESWEFRCFGNVSTKEDMIFCVNMARDAYMYARNKVASGYAYNENSWPLLVSNFESRLTAEIAKRERKQLRKAA